MIGCDLSVYLAMQKYSLMYNYFHQLQVEEARNKVAENSTKMYESVLEAHEKSKELEKLSKDLTKEIQILSKEKEAVEKQRTEAIRKRAKLDLDYKDLQEKMSTNIKAKVVFYCMTNNFSSQLQDYNVKLAIRINLLLSLIQDDAQKQLMILEREVQETKNALNDIKPLHEKQVKEEEDITRGYVNCMGHSFDQISEKTLDLLFSPPERVSFPEHMRF